MLGHTNWSELFPTKWSAFVFVSYMGLFIDQGILVTASQSSTSKYNYNTVTVVLLTEVLKLVASVLLYCKDNSLPSLLYEIRKYSRVMMLYFVPAFMYCLYNNLAFVNLATYDPTTYYLLLQFRVVITGIVFQVLFKKQLSCQQWVSLLLLTAGCMIKHLDPGSSRGGSAVSKDGTLSPQTTEESSFGREISTLLILVQTVCSCFAGVYNEFLLKGEGAQVNIFVQNVFMYIDSIICNAGVLLVQGTFSEAFQPSALAEMVRPTVILIMINNAAIGIVTSFFLKNLNSILKTFASALELIFTAVFCWLLFGIPIHLSTIAAIAIVSYSVLLYSQNPVVNQTPTSTSAQSKEPLLSPSEQV